VAEYTVSGSTYEYRVEGLESNTDYNVTVQARTQSGYHAGRNTVMRTEDLSEYTQFVVLCRDLQEPWMVSVPIEL
jgi:hypothetical protein